MKKVILIFSTALFLFSCADTEAPDTAEIDTIDTTNNVTLIDYSTMTFVDQEEDMNKRLNVLRNGQSEFPEVEREAYKLRVDNLENDIVVFREKKAAYEKDEENEELKAEVQTLGDKIRLAADELNNDLKSLGETLEDHHNQKVGDVENAAQEVKEGVQSASDKVKQGAKNVKETLKDHHNQKVEDVSEALEIE